MKKFLAVLMMAALLILGLGSFSPASATYNTPPSSDNKKVELCHATGSESNPYVKINVSVSAFYNAGHISHSDDIWNAFTYTDKKGRTVNVPARGNVGLLAFNDCKKPIVKEKVAKPDAVFVDVCGKEDDVFSVAPGRGYTVSDVVMEGSNQVITVTLETNFTWTDDSTTPLRFIKPAFTDVDCDLPDTGIGAEYNKTLGWVALGSAAILGAVLLITKRRNRSNS